MNKYEIRTEKKKVAIIQAALELFKERGFTSVSIKEIASRAHVSQVSIYNYFNSKDALVSECVNAIMKDLLNRAREILKEEGSFRDKLLSALGLCTTNIHTSLLEYFSRQALDDRILMNLISKSLQEQKRIIYKDYIELGKREGVIDNTISTETILDFFDLINMYGNKMSEKEIEVRVSEIHHLLLYGLIGKDQANNSNSY